jgi:hypothetical protein
VTEDETKWDTRLLANFFVAVGNGFRGKTAVHGKAAPCLAGGLLFVMYKVLECLAKAGLACPPFC